MKKVRTSKVNYNLYVEETPDFYQGMLTSIVKKETSETKDNYLFIYPKEILNKERVYFEIINNFIFKNFKEIKNKEEGITALNIITPYGEGLELLKSKYKRVSPYKAIPLAGNEIIFEKIRNNLQEERELGLQVQYVVISENEKNNEMKEMAHRINNEKYLNTHFFNASTYEKKHRISQKKPVVFKNDNTDIDIYFHINKKENNEYCFCSTIIKKNKYDQQKNHYYILNISANSERDALIKGIRECYTDDRKFVKILKSSHNINIFSENNYSEKIANIFNNILSEDSNVNLNNFIPENIKKNIINNIEKNSYRTEKKRVENLIQVDISVPCPPNTIIIYTDGSVKDKSELSCFGAVFRMPNSDNIIYEIAGNTTEDIAKNQIDYIENKGIEEALKFLSEKIKNKKISPDFNIEIRSDSFNNIREINKKLNNESTIDNEIWNEKIQKIVDISKLFKKQVSFKWVKGHHVDPYNNRADKMASLGYIADSDSIYVFHEDKELENKIKPQIKERMRKRYR